MPLLPPPFIILVNLVRIVLFIFNKVKNQFQPKSTSTLDAIFSDNNMNNNGQTLQAGSIILPVIALGRSESSDRKYSINVYNATLIEKKMTKQVLDNMFT